MATCTCNKHIKSSAMNRVNKFDPTKTLTLRRAFVADMLRRFKSIRRDIITTVDTNDAFGLKQTRNEAAPTDAFAFTRTDDKVRAFMAWLAEEQRSTVLETNFSLRAGTSLNAAWTDIYIENSYVKGVKDAQAKLRAIGVQSAETFDTSLSAVQATFAQPVHADRAGVLYTRTFNELEGVTAAMDQEISRTLTSGLIQGDNPTKIALALADRVDAIGINRAEMIARTEVIRAHHLATVQEYRNAGVFGVKVIAEWLTAGDSRVCAICSDFASQNNGYGSGIYTLDQIESLIPAHPRCRCSSAPVVLEPKSDN